MAGINNLGNVKLTNLQLNATKVDTKAPEQKVGDAKPSAVWNAGKKANVQNWKEGDIVIAKQRGQKIYYRVNDKGALDPITRDTITSLDFNGGGDYSQSDYARGNY